MSEYSPVAILFTSDSVELAAKTATATTVDSRGFIGVGVDAGGTARFLRIDGSGQLIVVGQGVAGTPAGGVVSVQGVSGGQALPVSGTTTSNQGTAGSHAQRWMIGLSDGTAFISPATDRTTAAAPFAFRLSDGTAFYDGVKTAQLPAALVGGRLDANTGAWLGSTAPTVGQKTMAASLPVAIASDQTAIPVSQGTAAATAGRWPVALTDGVSIVDVIPAGESAVPADKALVVAPSPNTIGLVELAGSNVSAFGDPIAATLTPLFQFDFVGRLITAGTMTQQGGAYVANTGTAATNGGRLQLASGTNAAGAAVYVSYKIARYRAGQGMVARFTVAFQTGVANNIQVAGACAPTLTWTNNATAPGAPITAATVGDGYFFGYNGVAFGVRHKNSRGNGGAGLDTWTAQTAWNSDRCDGTSSATNPSGFLLDPTKGNVYMIKYPYLGYGNIQFYVMNNTTGRWILVHVIQYANSFVETQLQNPGLSFFAQTINGGSVTNVTMLIGSVGFFLTGDRVYTGPQFGVDNRLANNGVNVDTPVFSLRCCTSLNGEPNRGMMRLRSLSFSGDGANTDLRVTIRRNPALTGATFANAIFGTITAGSAGFILTAAQSMATFDTAATAITAAAANTSQTVFNAVAARSTGYQIDLASYDIFIVPGDTLTFVARSTSTGNAVQVAVNWQEDI